MEILILTIIRLTVPLIMLRYPLSGFILTILVDSLDWTFYPFYSPSDYEIYQVWDKFLDIYFLAISLIVVLKWSDVLARKTAIILFFLRFFGVILATLISIREIYLITPNIYLAFFLFTIILMKLKKQTTIYTSKVEVMITLIALSIPFLIGEYFVHYIKKLPWEYSWGEIIEGDNMYSLLINQLIWFLLLLLIPTILFIIMYRKKDSKNEKD